MKNRQKRWKGNKSVLELILNQKIESLMFWNGSKIVSMQNGSKDTDYHDRQINKLDKEIEDLTKEIEEIENGPR